MEEAQSKAWEQMSTQTDPPVLNAHLPPDGVPIKLLCTNATHCLHTLAQSRSTFATCDSHLRCFAIHFTIPLSPCTYVVARFRI